MNINNQPSALSSNASVHASAGSGKTYLLVSRIVRLLLLDTAPANILAITFTRKAASEMQTRLMERLFEISHADDEQLSNTLRELEVPDSEQLKHQARRLYEKLLHDTQSIKVTTFHAFCQDLLRRFPLEADVPPGFELEDKTATLRKTAWHALMSEASNHPQSATTQSLQQLLSYVSPVQMQTLLERFLGYRSDWWAYTQQADDPLDHAQQQLSIKLDCQPTLNSAEHFFLEHSNYIQRYAELLAKHPNATNNKILDKLAQGLAEKDSNPAQGLWSVTTALFTTSNEPRKQKSSKTLVTKLGENGAEEFIELHFKLAAIIEQTHKKIAAQQIIKVNQAWLTAGQAYLNHYQNIKNEQRVLDFTDLEWKTYQLLNQGNNALWIQYKLDERIEHLLIDEFQDTNPTQWHLILPLLNELAAGSAERNRSVFLVGDAKQSIYRFRRANAQLFSQASQWLEKNIKAHRFPLNKSWRSSPAIMGFVNTLFENFNTLDFDFEKHETFREDLYGEVTLLPLNKTQSSDEVLTGELRNPLLTPRVEKENQLFLQEGYQISAAIQDLLNQQKPIQDGDAIRPVQYNDILVLFKNRTHIKFYEQAFREKGIPYIGADRGTLLESLEVNDMLNLLQWLITPYDNLALAGILKSPLFNARDDDLLELSHLNTTDWFSALGNLIHEDERSDSLKRAYSMLSEWLLLTGHIPVHDLLDKIYSQANVIARYTSAFPAHMSGRVHANLTRFIELALEMDSGRYPSLTKFTSWINELKQQTDDAPDAPSETGDGNRITLMTIHAAKGLEAPVVFLADSGSETKDKNSNSVIIDWPADQLQPRQFILAHKTDFTPDYIQHCFEEENRQAQRENINLLYVAITRAKQYLFISACQPRRSSSLGWYGLVAQHHQLNSDDLEEPVLLSEPATAPALNYTVPKINNVDIDDENLNGPFNFSPLYREIAPSRSVIHTCNSADTDSDAKERGILIHLMLEKLSLIPSISLAEITTNIQVTINQQELEDCWQEAQNIIHHENLKYLFDPQQYQYAHTEVPLIYKQGENMVHGIIDRLIVMQDVIHIIDYKTHQDVDDSNLEKLVKQYQPQMSLYVEGVKQIWPEHNIQASILFTHCAKLEAVITER